jgi:LacI family transcriptional regulator
MTHRFPIKEIAFQTGLSTATIDRVINERPNVSPQTKLRVKAAIQDLGRQETQLSTHGRRLFFDFVIEAPTRFSVEVKQAAESVLPNLSNAICRSRFTLQEVMTEDEVIVILKRIAKRGSHGVCLKARDLPKIRSAVEDLWKCGIPVVTLVTDLPETNRIAYVGINNTGAGRTAAYLIRHAIKDEPGTILTVLSQSTFLGEETRSISFKEAIANYCPKLKIVEVSGGSGIRHGTLKRLEDVATDLADIQAVYSMGGGNKVVLDFIDKFLDKPKIFIAHDADNENSTLLADCKIDFVLDHDLKADAQNVFLSFLDFHKLTPQAIQSEFSKLTILTPENLLD